MWRYPYEEWGEQHADRYLDELEAGIARLQDHPGLGRMRDEVRQGYRSLGINHHVVFYTVEGEVIRIIRVLHARMDPDSHL
ncbi:type II toxin-antitoxin system RelE/ParE family toxin (plasmid) [Azoarcus sp. PA01]|nr:type II toxin-antitoxin system RelE/ParE family toxin [Azoarcus sp. PA01]